MPLFHLFLLPALLLATGAAPGAGDDPTCVMSLSMARNPPRFAAYPAIRSRRAPVAPLLSSRMARLYRTILREGAAKGPDFGGHYTIVAWGCGASCNNFAIVDSLSGRIFFPPPRLQAISIAGNQDEPSEPGKWSMLGYRPDSRLLIIFGIPDQDHAREGATYLEWTGQRLKPIRFISRRELCGPKR